MTRNKTKNPPTAAAAAAHLAHVVETLELLQAQQTTNHAVILESLAVYQQTLNGLVVAMNVLQETQRELRARIVRLEKHAVTGGMRVMTPAETKTALYADHAQRIRAIQAEVDAETLSSDTCLSCRHARGEHEGGPCRYQSEACEALELQQGHRSGALDCPCTHFVENYWPHNSAADDDVLDRELALDLEDLNDAATEMFFPTRESLEIDQSMHELDRLGVPR